MNYEIYSCICTCMYACLRVCMHMYVLQCMCTCMYAYVRVCAYVSVCLLHMCTVHVCTYVYLRMCTRTYAGLYWRVCTVQCFSTMLCLYCGLNVCCCRTHQNLHFYVVFRNYIKRNPSQLLFQCLICGKLVSVYSVYCRLAITGSL